MLAALIARFITPPEHPPVHSSSPRLSIFRFRILSISPAVAHAPYCFTAILSPVVDRPRYSVKKWNLRGRGMTVEGIRLRHFL